VNTQNAPIHIQLWHRDFWLMVMANLLLSASVTMLIPTLPLRMLYTDGLSVFETGIVMGVFAIGLFFPGGLCSFLVQKYRRNMVCVWAILVLAATIAVPYYWRLMPFGVLLALRFVQGAAFGLAEMVLASTLIIDTCKSFQRTEANHSATWFGRFALSIGPMAGLLFYHLFDFNMVVLASLGCLAVAVLLILSVHFPFRVPGDELHVWSLDRFFLPNSCLLFANLMLPMMGIGMVLSLTHDAHFYGYMMIGFLLALLAQTFVFSDADLKSEIVAGLLLIAASLFILLFSPQSPLHSPLLGLGIGLIGSRFLLFFIKLSRHCQRGTAQSTFLLAWEGGLALGIGIGYCFFEANREVLLMVALLLTALALALYVLYTHQWFVKHKNR